MRKPNLELVLQHETYKQKIERLRIYQNEIADEMKDLSFRIAAKIPDHRDLNFEFKENKELWHKCAEEIELLQPLWRKLLCWRY